MSVFRHVFLILDRSASNDQIHFVSMYNDLLDKKILLLYYRDATSR